MFQKTAALENFAAQLEEEDLGEDWMEREIEGPTAPEITDEQAGEVLQEFEEDHDMFHFVQVEDPQAGNWTSWTRPCYASLLRDDGRPSVGWQSMVIG